MDPLLVLAVAMFCLPSPASVVVASSIIHRRIRTEPAARTYVYSTCQAMQLMQISCGNIQEPIGHYAARNDAA